MHSIKVTARKRALHWQTAVSQHGRWKPPCRAGLQLQQAGVRKGVRALASYRTPGWALHEPMDSIRNNHFPLQHYHISSAWSRNDKSWELLLKHDNKPAAGCDLKPHLPVHCRSCATPSHHPYGRCCPVMRQLGAARLVACPPPPCLALWGLAACLLRWGIF